MPRLIIISGVPGAGKTVTMAALSDEMSKADIAHGSIDLDQLCQAWPQNDQYNSDLGFKNLAAVWPNYSEVGVQAMVIARVVETPDELDRYRQAIPGADLCVIRVVGEQSDIDARLADREYGDWIPRMQARSRELSDALENARLETFVIENRDKSIEDLGREAFAQLNKISFFD